MGFERFHYPSGVCDGFVVRGERFLHRLDLVRVNDLFPAEAESRAEFGLATDLSTSLKSIVTMSIACSPYAAQAVTTACRAYNNSMAFSVRVAPMEAAKSSPPKMMPSSLGWDAISFRFKIPLAVSTPTSIRTELTGQPLASSAAFDDLAAPLDLLQ